MPGLSASTRKAVKPFTPLDLSVWAITVNTCAYSAHVIKHLEPLMTHSSPSCLAVVLTPPASDPALGSVSANAAKPPSAISSQNNCCCSGVPATSRGLKPSPHAPMETAIPASYLPNSSKIRALVVLSKPRPPFSSGISNRWIPISNNLLYTSSSGK